VTYRQMLFSHRQLHQGDGRVVEAACRIDGLPALALHWRRRSRGRRRTRAGEGDRYLQAGNRRCRTSRITGRRVLNGALSLARRASDSVERSRRGSALLPDRRPAARDKGFAAPEAERVSLPRIVSAVRERSEQFSRLRPLGLR
jgi:hypothetical protein